MSEYIAQRVCVNTGNKGTPMGSLILQLKNACMLLSAMLVLTGIGQGALAQVDPFVNGWTLNADASNLKFQSVKNQTKVETSGFATFDGTIDQSGTAKISILLDSVDTKVDLRNVRMRFLFFETFQYPTATITAQLDPAALADLGTVRRKTISMPYTLDLHGLQKEFTTDVVVTLLTDDLVSVATSVPISVATADFNLTGGVQKLEEAANVEILPSATVSFDFMFARNASGSSLKVIEIEAPATAALEAEGDFDLEACKGRFEILSRTGNIYFATGSAALDPKSTPLLNALADIVKRCPSLIIEVGGHTDSDGSKAANQRLSKARAASVSDFLVASGIDRQRVQSVGYGEDFPVFPNTTPSNKGRNRRIEFGVVNK